MESGCEKKVVTYWEAILQDKLPKSVIIIGSGAIGVEFATVWNSYGVDVTIVEMLPRIVPLEDEEISKELDKEFKKRGIKTLAGHKVESVEATKTGVKVKVSADASTLRQAQGNASLSTSGKETTLKRIRPWSRSGSVPIRRDSVSRKSASRSVTAALSRSMKRCKRISLVFGQLAM